MANTIESQIKAYITREFLNGRPSSMLDGNLIEQEVIDSLGIIMLIGYVEEQFGSKIEAEEHLPVARVRFRLGPRSDDSDQRDPSGTKY